MQEFSATIAAIMQPPKMLAITYPVEEFSNVAKNKSKSNKENIVPLHSNNVNGIVPQSVKQTNKPEETCMFCKSTNKHENCCGLVTKCTHTDLENIKSIATELNDLYTLKYLEVLKKLNISSVYHSCCRCQYRKRFTKLPSKEKLSWQKVHNNHDRAFKKLCSFIEKHVIKRKKCYLLTYLEHIYVLRLHIEYKKEPYDPESTTFFATQHLHKLIEKKFEDKIVVVESNNKLIVKSHCTNFKKVNRPKLEASLDFLIKGIKSRQDFLVSDEAKKSDGSDLMNELNEFVAQRFIYEMYKTKLQFYEKIDYEHMLTEVRDVVIKNGKKIYVASKKVDDSCIQLRLAQID